MKVAFITNKTPYLLNTRTKLMEEIQKNGHEIIAICPKNDLTDKMKVELEKRNIKYIPMYFDRTSLILHTNIKILFSLVKILKMEQPDVVFTCTIKPIIFGSIAAKIAKIKNIYALICGMGYIYSIDRFTIKVVRGFCNIGYRIALHCNTKVIFQNKDDKEELIKRKFVRKEQAEIVDGSGVDMEVFKKHPLQKNTISFLLICRMLNVKGVEEFCKAAEIVKTKYPDVKFIHIGSKVNGYRGVNEKEIEKYKSENIVEFHGWQRDVEKYISESTVVVLPSYLREGIPRVLLEALAVGRPILTTNVRGCKETVKEGINGYTIPKKDEKSLAEKMIYMIEHKDKLENMAEESYKYAKERFDIKIINDNMLKIMNL